MEARSVFEHCFANWNIAHSLRCIGYLGLKDIFIESQIVADCSISGVIDGKHYNRGVRAHKYLYEALMRLAWAEFTKKA